MKKIVSLTLTLCAFLASSFAVSAQDVDECMMYMSYYQEYYNQKPATTQSRLAAVPSWRKAYSLCNPENPKQRRQNLYIHGAALYRLLIAQNAKNPEYRAALIDTLLTLHEQRATYYPNYAEKAYVSLCQDVNNYLKNEPQKAYDILNRVIEKQGYKAGPDAFVARMTASVALYKEGKSTPERVIADYDESINNFIEIQKSDTTQNTKDLRATVEALFINSRVASCENLQTLFGPRFEECKDDIDAVTKIVKLMAGADDCTDNELFLKAATQMHTLSPSSNSAYYLFRLNADKDIKLASKYLEEAASDESLDAETRGQYNYELAAFCVKNGQNVRAVDAANKAISIDPSLAGKANMIIGHAWMSTGCSDDVERYAKFWVAYDYFARAKAADPSIADDAAKQMSTCASYFPQASEIFMYNVNTGESYTASCGGLRANTTVKTH